MIIGDELQGIGNTGNEIFLFNGGHYAVYLETVNENRCLYIKSDMDQACTIIFKCILYESAQINVIWVFNVEIKMLQIFRVLLTLFLVFSLGIASSALPRDPAKFFYEQTLGDLTDDLQDAKDKGKKGVLVFFHQEECPFCHRMKTTIMNQVKVQEYYQKRFLILEIDIESAGEIVAFDGSTTTMKKYFSKIANNKGATPVFAFFDLQGKLVVRYTGATSGAKEFIWLGEYASEQIYKKMTFSRYKRVKRKEERAAR